jgi:hypothetical protein
MLRPGLRVGSLTSGSRGGVPDVEEAEEVKEAEEVGGKKKKQMLRSAQHDAGCWAAAATHKESENPHVSTTCGGAHHPIS